MELTVNAVNIKMAIETNGFDWWAERNGLYRADDIFSLCVNLGLTAKKRDRKGMINALRGFYC